MKFLMGEKLVYDRRVVSVTVISTLLLMVDHYHRLTSYKYLDRVILYLLIPLIIVVLVHRENPALYGFSFGNWRLGLAYTIVGIGSMTPIIYLTAHSSPSMKAYYEGLLVGLPWTTFLDLLGWEFFFRGWILFTYARKFGPEALWLQAVPFAIAHLSKPELETLSTIFGGFAFGWIAWQTKSFIWPFLIHWYIGSYIILVASGTVG
ncbi:MAG: CPBP family intramembrane metalloprotease [Anaerolineaceae bacterium]|nr:CPBP family intramembrane metalloprotease [Anaerolineaceae bacterium]